MVTDNYGKDFMILSRILKLFKSIMDFTKKEFFFIHVSTNMTL